LPCGQSRTALPPVRNVIGCTDLWSSPRVRDLRKFADQGWTKRRELLLLLYPERKGTNASSLSQSSLLSSTNKAPADDHAVTCQKFQEQRESMPHTLPFHQTRTTATVCAVGTCASEMETFAPSCATPCDIHASPTRLPS
jgi:hypothetical protein